MANLIASACHTMSKSSPCFSATASSISGLFLELQDHEMEAAQSRKDGHRVCHTGRSRDAAQSDTCMADLLASPGHTMSTTSSDFSARLPSTSESFLELDDCDIEDEQLERDDESDTATIRRSQSEELCSEQVGRHSVSREDASILHMDDSAALGTADNIGAQTAPAAEQEGTSIEPEEDTANFQAGHSGSQEATNIPAVQVEAITEQGLDLEDVAARASAGQAEEHSN